MDRGLWVTWYDLPEQSRDAYLSWLHDEYIPAVLKRPGYLWAAHYASVEEKKVPRRKSGSKHSTTDPEVPHGDRYILLFGAEDSNVFGNPLPREINAELPAKGQQMLALRIGERTNIMTEAARLDGPEAKHYREGVTLAPCIQMGSFQARWQDEDEALSWYAKWRMPSMSKLEGCVRVRKLASVAGWAKQSILYEFTSQEARDHFLHSHEDGEQHRDWTDNVIAALVHAPGSANVGLRLWPTVKK